MAIEINRGYISLLDAIFEVEDKDALFLLYDFCPPGKKHCLGCGKLLLKYSYCHKTLDYCSDCEHERRFVSLICGQCGKEFKLSRAEYNGRLRRRKVPLFFCSRYCYGKYAAEHWGFIVYPEHIRMGRYKKWDYSKVYSLWEETGWTQRKIGETLGIPRTTIRYILRQYPTYVNRPHRAAKVKAEKDYGIRKCIGCGEPIPRTRRSLFCSIKCYYRMRALYRYYNGIYYGKRRKVPV